MKRIIAASFEQVANMVIKRYANNEFRFVQDPDRSIKFLVRKFNEDLLAETTNERQLVIQHGLDLLNYIEEKLPGELSQDDMVSALKYFGQLEKRVAAAKDIKASELPPGYLGTSKFTAPSIKTADQRNVAQAIDIAICCKFDQFERFCDRQLSLTSCSSWTGDVFVTADGLYYIKLEATRSNFVAFVSGDTVVRKPVNVRFVAKYSVSGDRGTIHYVSRRKEL